jgi:hypothetical protein
VVFKTAFLYEGGLLPRSNDERSNTFLENIVAAGVDNSELPRCPEDYWGRLNAWLSSLMEINGLRKREK